MLEHIEKLCNLSGPSGDEGRVREYIASVVRPYVDELYSDDLGSLYAVKHGGGNRKIMLDAHMDEVGMIVTGVDSNGFVKFAYVGLCECKIMNS